MYLKTVYTSSCVDPCIHSLPFYSRLQYSTTNWIADEPVFRNAPYIRLTRQAKTRYFHFLSPILSPSPNKRVVAFKLPSKQYILLYFPLREHFSSLNQPPINLYYILILPFLCSSKTSYFFFLNLKTLTFFLSVWQFVPKLPYQSHGSIHHSQSYM